MRRFTFTRTLEYAFLESYFKKLACRTDTVLEGSSREGVVASIPDAASKRLEQRFETSIPVKIRNINGTDWFNGRLVNMSKSGACLEGRFTRKIGAAIEVYLTSSIHNLPNHCILASIVWATGEKTGLKFIFSK